MKINAEYRINLEGVQKEQTLSEKEKQIRSLRKELRTLRKRSKLDKKIGKFKKDEDEEIVVEAVKVEIN